MKWTVVLFCVVTVSLIGCQSASSFFPFAEKEKEIIKPKPIVHKHEQIIEYGAKFAEVYDKAPEETCKKYNKAFQQGDWRAGWVLALQVSENAKNQCLNINQTVKMLTTLESEKRIDPDLIWLNQNHLLLLQKLQQETIKLNQLNALLRNNKQKLVDLEAKNQDLTEKLEALKAIETSIHE